MEKRREGGGGAVEIAYAIHDYFGSYYQYLWISMKSVLTHTGGDIRFHILCDPTLTAQARRELGKLCENYGQEIVFHETRVDDRISMTDLWECGYNAGILYRLALPEILPGLSKILYLDADIVANGDVQELWDIDVSGYALAGLWTPPVTGYKAVDAARQETLLPFWENTDWNYYINSGVLLMNLDRMRRKGNLWNLTVDFLDTYGMAFPDQDALNYIFEGEKLLLPYQFNVLGGAMDCPEVVPGLIYHYGYRYDDDDKLDEVDRWVLAYYETAPFYPGELSDKEKVCFLRKLKSRLDVYVQLENAGRLTADKAFLLGRALFREGRYEDACRYLEKTKTLEQKAQTDEAVLFPEQYKASSENSLEMLSTHYIVLSLEKAGRQEEITDYLGDFLKRLEEKRRGKPQSYIGKDALETNLWYLYGEGLRKKGDFPAAEAAFLKCLYFGSIEKYLTAKAALLSLTKCCMKRGDIEKAADYNNRLLSLDVQNKAAKWNQLKIQFERQKST